MRNEKKVVVVTLNYNQSKMTLECVKSILASTYRNFVSIVIDNGSNIQEFDFLKKNIDPRIRIERINENCGYVGGVNKGLRIGSKLDPDYFLIMNNDTVIDPGAIDKLVDAGDRYNQCAIVSGKVYHFDRPNVLQYVGSIFEDRRYLEMSDLHRHEVDEGQCDTEQERDMLDDIFWLLPKKIYDDIGEYSNNYFLYAEQADYALNAVRNGYKLIYTPGAKLWHKGSITTGGGNRFAPPVNFWRNKSKIIYLYRNTKRIYFFHYLLLNLSKLVTKNLLNFFNLRKVENKESEYSALIGYFYGLKWIMNQKPDNGYNPFIR